MNETRLERIREKIGQLARKDKKHRIFGAAERQNGHGYKLNPVLSEMELGAVEEQFGISLPADYRTFLMEIGNGGAGPFYGLCSLEKGI